MEAQREAAKVFVLDAEGKPLLPTHPAKARKLLRSGQANVFQVVPFTIQLTKVVDAPQGEFTLGIDDGAIEVGIAVVNQAAREVVFTGVIKLREDVTRKMTQRRMYRSKRRWRNLRHRKARFNRSKPKGWIAPTIRQKKDSIVRVAKDLRRIINITHVVVEQGVFDIREMASSKHQITEYEGSNFRAKVLWRDNYTCQRCGGKQKLRAHHIHERSTGGSSTPDNGITLCLNCHDALHEGKWKIKAKSSKFLSPQQATVYYGISPFGADFAEHLSPQAAGN